MINPNQITNFHRTKEELEEFWLFSILVAGKNSKVAAAALDRMLKHVDKPFVFLRNLTDKERLILLKSCRTGQYNRINNAIRDSFDVNLRSCDVAELEGINGCGPKTARFFLMHTRPNIKEGVLDTHILKWLRSKGHDAPKQTPQNKKVYKKYSEIFQKEVEKEGKWSTLAEADLEIWKYYSK